MRKAGQVDPNNPNCEESSACPAELDSEYGREKLFSERLYFAFQRNFELDVQVARFHNIFGPLGTWDGGREKAPAALCRKIAAAPDGGSIEIWGDGEQTRSFLYFDECVQDVRLLINSDFAGSVNIGSDEMVTIDGMAHMIMDIAGKKLEIRHISEGFISARPWPRSPITQVVEDRWCRFRRVLRSDGCRRGAPDDFADSLRQFVCY